MPDRQDDRRYAPEIFRPDCKLCPRLAQHLVKMRAEHPSYHNAPVAPFGESKAPLLIVGLAPGAHGANATGRPFTGDHAGLILYSTLHGAGLSSQPVSLAPPSTRCRSNRSIACSIDGRG